MSRWTDLATWVGPSPNVGGRMAPDVRGVVIHIAEGSYDGTIAWQRNPDADVSSHFIVARDGRIAQMVDTDLVAWTQADGNGHWLSVENEGRSGSLLTAAQVAANGTLLARAHREYGVPLQLTSSTTGRGLGHHSMGGVPWGNHPNCPGTPIIGQKASILAAATKGDIMTFTSADAELLSKADVFRNGYGDKETNPNIALDTFVFNVGRDTTATLKAVTELTAAVAALTELVAAIPGAPGDSGDVAALRLTVANALIAAAAAIEPTP